MNKAKKPLQTAAILFFGLLILAYSNHFNNTFHFDDAHTIVDNVNIRTLKNIPKFFTDPTMFSANPQHHHLRPLVTTTLAIDYWLGGGLYPFFFQFSTFLWHIGLCVLLFFVYRIIIGKATQHQWANYIAFGAVALFGIHTAIAETLNYIISRSDVLSTFFILLSLWLYIQFPEKRKWGLYILAAIVGVFAKETVPVLLIILFFYSLFFEEKLSVPQIFRAANFKTISKIIIRLLPLFVAVALAILYTLTRVNSETKEAGLTNPIGYYWLTQTYVWLRYFVTFFLPMHLSADTDLSVITRLSDWRVVVGVSFVLLLIIAIIKTSKEGATRPISLGLIWFAASLLPTSLLPFAEVMNDHRMYFAFTGLSLAVVYTVGWVLLKNKGNIFGIERNKKVVVGVVCLILCIHAWGVFQRNEVWHTEESLWKDVTEKSPENGRGWMNYGLALMSRADFGGAIQAYKRAEVTNPSYSYLFINFGIAYGALQDSARAHEYFEKAIALEPADYNSYVYFARYQFEKGNIAQAKTLAEKALQLNNGSYLARDIAMGSYQALKMWPELESMAASTLQLVPGDQKTLAYRQAAKDKTPLVVATQNTGNLPNTSLLINLSLEQYNAGNYEDCIATCNLIIQQDPKNADAYNNICAAYNMLKEWNKAKAACAKALQLNPNHANAPANLKWAIEQKLN